MPSLETLLAILLTVGAALAWRNTLQLYRDRCLRGIYWPTMLCFTASGALMLPHFAHTGQWWSFFAAIALLGGNAAWVSLAVHIQVTDAVDRALMPISYGAKSHDH